MMKEYGAIYGVDSIVKIEGRISPERERELWIGDIMSRHRITSQQALRAWYELLETIERRREERVTEGL